MLLIFVKYTHLQHGYELAQHIKRLENKIHSSAVSALTSWLFFSFHVLSFIQSHKVSWDNNVNMEMTTDSFTGWLEWWKWHKLNLNSKWSTKNERTTWRGREKCQRVQVWLHWSQYIVCKCLFVLLYGHLMCDRWLLPSLIKRTNMLRFFKCENRLLMIANQWENPKPSGGCWSFKKRESSLLAYIIHHPSG